MKIQILKCKKCGSYGLKKICECGNERVLVKPARYSPLDPYAKYRRKEKAKMVGIDGMENI